MIRVPQPAERRERSEPWADRKTFVPGSAAEPPERPTIGSAPQPSSALGARLANGLRDTWGPEGKAQRKCRLCRIQPDVQLIEHTNERGRRMTLGGVSTCKSSLCPLCAPKWAATRAEEITQAVENWGHLFCRFVTLTMQHHRGMLLALQQRLLSGAYGQLWSGRDGKALAEAIGGKPESVRGLDRTWSLERSWHPHIHALLFLQSNELADKTLTELLGDRWPEALGLQLRRMKRACARVLSRTDEPLGTIAKLLELDLTEPKEAKRAARFRRNLRAKQGPLDDGSCDLSRGCGCMVCVKRRIRRVFGSRLIPRNGDLVEHLRRLAVELGAFTQSNIEPRESTRGVHLERLREANKASTYLSKLGLEIAWNASKQPNRVHGIDHYPYWALAHLATIHGHPLRGEARRAWGELFRATRGTQQIVFSSRERLGLGEDPYADGQEPPDEQPGDLSRLIGTIHGGTWDRLTKQQKHGFLVTLHVAHEKDLLGELPYVQPAPWLHGIPANRGPPPRYEPPSPLLRATRTATAEERGRALARLLSAVELPDLHVDPIRWGTRSKVTVEDIRERIDHAKQLRLNYQIDW